MRFPRSENLFNSLRKREQGNRLTPQQKSTIIRNLSSNMEARAIIGQAEFDYSIQKAKEEKGEPRLNFSLRDLRKVTFPPAVDEANENYETFIKSLFSGAILDKKNLSGLNFQLANFSNAKLTEVDLSFSKLQNTNFTKAKLKGADLTGAKLNRAELMQSDLTGVRLQHAFLTEAKLNGADLRWAFSPNAKLIGADLTGADLSYAILNDANLNGADLTRAKLYGANLTKAKLSRADLTGANLNYADLTGADITGAKVANVIQASINEKNIHFQPQFYRFLKALDKTQRKEILGTGNTSASEYLQNLKIKLTGNPYKITQIDNLLNVVKSFEKQLKGEIESPLSPTPQNPSQSRFKQISEGIGCSIS